MLEAIAAIGAEPFVADITAAHRSAPVQSFGDWMAAEIHAVDSKVQQSDAAAQSVAMGSADNLHDVMIRMEEARLSFQLLAQVRNKLLEGYQEIMRMQV
jgi:flagellar hook-basal body complex protein FliE